jgi:hypothetical protein
MQQFHSPKGLYAGCRYNEKGGFSATSSAAIYDNYNILWSGFDNASFGYYNGEAERA